MGNWSNSGALCTSRGRYVDDGTMCRDLTTAPGPVCTVASAAPVPDSLRRALEEFESTAVNFATRFIPDHALRLQYINKIKAMSAGILEDFQLNRISAQEGATLANRLRNQILETTRDASSDVGRAWAESLKARGKSLVELQEKYASELFQREFGTLAEAERNQVFLEIVESSGRARPSVLATSARLAKLSEGLLFVTAAVAVYQVATSDRPGREAIKQGAVVGVGFGAAEVIGAAAATSLVCGPGAPVCVGIFVFVGGAAAAFGADFAFDRLWK